MPKVPVTERALVQRINRKLAHEHKRLHTAHPASRMFHNCGSYYLIDSYRNELIDSHVDIVKLASKLDVLGGWEEIERKRSVS